MRILVTGAAGYIGSVCVEELLNAKHEVIALDNLSEGHRSAVDTRAEFVKCDLGEREKLFEVLSQKRPEAVIHFAGKALVPESMRDPSIYYRTNVACGLNLLDAMLSVGCKKIIFSSTCATYGLPDKVPIDELISQHPINPYGHSKLMFEQILQWYEKIHGITFVALRYFNAAGASKSFGEDHRVETHLIPNVLRVALGKGDRVEIYGNTYPTPDGTCIRDYIHVIDLAAAHILALKCRTSVAFNLGSGQGYSVLQVVQTAHKVTGHSIPIEYHPARSGDPPRLIANNDKIRQELKWEPKHSTLVNIISSAWAWHQTNPHGYPS